MLCSPPAKVSETDHAYLVHVELPGVRKDQVDVQLQDRELVISGERMTLLDVLRERLRLFGTKKGCDQGQCGRVHGAR